MPGSPVVPDCPSGPIVPASMAGGQGDERAAAAKARAPDLGARPPVWSKATRRGFEGLSRLLFRTYCPLEVTGQAHLPRLPFLLCSNHSSHLDGPALMMASTYGFDRFGLLAASDYFFRSPWQYRFFSSLVRLIPVSRNASLEGLLHTLAACREFVAGDGRGLIVFPEGTRSTSGSIGPFKPGIGLLSLRLGLPVVPAYIEGSGDAMAKGRLLPAPRRVTVRIGPPIDPGGDPGDAREYERIAGEARRRIEQMGRPTGGRPG